MAQLKDTVIQGDARITGTTYAKVVGTLNGGNAIPYITGTGSTAGTWLGQSDAITSYYDGLLILYKIPIAGASTTTLNINNLGAKTCYLNGSGKLTTHFPVNQPILLVYSTTNSGCWVALDNYDSNSNTYDRTYINTTFKAAAATTAGFLLCGTDAGYKNVAKGTAFDVSYPVLYSASAIAASGTRTDGYIQIPMNCTATNGGTSPAFTAYKMVYLKGTLSGNTFTIDSSTLFTQAIPTSADNKYYYALGIAGNATSIFLQPHHDIYAYTNGSFHRMDLALGALAYKGSVSASYTPAGTVTKPTFSGTQGSVSVSGSTSGVAVTKHTYTPAGTISVGTGTANYTPAGTVSTPTITVTLDTASVGSASGWSTGTATTPLAASATKGVLTLTAGTKGTVPSLTVTSTTVATGIESATSSQPTFTGTGKELKFTGTSADLTHTVTQGTVSASGNFTPAGTVTQPTFTGTQATITSN